MASNDTPKRTTPPSFGFDTDDIRPFQLFDGAGDETDYETGYRHGLQAADEADGGQHLVVLTFGVAFGLILGLGLGWLCWA